MNMLKNFGFTFVAFAALIAVPLTLAPSATVSAAEGTVVTIDYSSLSFSSAGGASLK